MKRNICVGLVVAACVALTACTVLFGDAVEQNDLAAPIEPPDEAVPHDMAVAAPADLLHAWTYQKLQAGALHGVWAGPTDGGSVAYAVGAGGGIYVSLDEGDTWRQVPSTTSANLYDVFGRSADDVYATGDPLPTPTSGGIAMAMFLNGDRDGFTRDDAPLSGSTGMGLWSAGPGEKIWAAGPCASFSSSGTGAGPVSWVGEPGYGCDFPVGPWGTASNDVWFGASDFYNPPNLFVAHSTGVGFVAAGIDFPTSMRRYGLFGFGTPGITSELWAVGDNTTVERWTLASGWQVDHAGDGGVPLRNLWGTAATDLWAVGGDNTVLHRTAAGWITEALPGLDKLTLFDVIGLPSGRVIAVGEFGYVFVRK